MVPVCPRPASPQANPKPPACRPPAFVLPQHPRQEWGTGLYLPVVHPHPLPLWYPLSVPDRGWGSLDPHPPSTVGRRLLTQLKTGPAERGGGLQPRPLCWEERGQCQCPGRLSPLESEGKEARPGTWHRQAPHPGGFFELEGVCQLPDQCRLPGTAPKAEEASWGQFGLGSRKKMPLC